MTRTFLTRRSLVAAACTWPFLPALAQKGGGDLVVGQSLPLSGMMAPTMGGVLAGQQMALDEANRKGGIHGRRVRIAMLDDAFDPRRSLENARKLVEEEGAIALFGFVGTAQTASVLPFIADRQVPLIAAYSGSPSLRAQPNPWFFTTQASYTDEISRILRNLKSVQATQLGVVYQNNEFGRGLLPLVERAIKEEGATLVGARPLDPSGSDAAAVAQSFGATKPQAVLMLVAGPAVVAYVRANRAHLGVPVYTLSLSVGSAILKALGEDARGLAVSRATPYPWRATTPLAREFTALMEKQDKPIDYDHFLGYINGRILVEGLRAAGRNPTPAAVKAGMEKLTKLDLGGYTLNYGPAQHHGSNFVEITVVGPRGNFIR